MVAINNYIVISREDVTNYLDDTENKILTALLSKINQECIDKGISMKEYLVCNLKKVDLEKFVNENNFKNGVDIGTRL